MGMENLIGEVGDDLFGKSREAFGDLELVHLQPGSQFESAYSRELSRGPSYGLEDLELYRTVQRTRLVSDMLRHYVETISQERGMDPAVTKIVTEIRQVITENLDKLGFKYSERELDEFDTTVELQQRVNVYANDIAIEQRNEVFLGKALPGDSLVVGGRHVAGIMEGFDGNVLVVNSVTNQIHYLDGLRERQVEMYESFK